MKATALLTWKKEAINIKEEAICSNVTGEHTGQYDYQSYYHNKVQRRSTYVTTISVNAIRSSPGSSDTQVFDYNHIESFFSNYHNNQIDFKAA